MIQPLKNRVLIERDTPEKITESGFIIPEEAQKKEVFGTVIGTGPDVKDVEVGQRVLFGQHDGFDVESRYCDGKENCILVRDEQIRGVING
jgi:co-chaperonin GroES (HSP10)